MDDIEEAIQRLQDDLHVLKRARAIIKAKAQTGRYEPASGKGIGKGKRDIKPDSDAGQAWAVLREAGSPLHIKDIVKGIEKKKGKAPILASVVSVLARYSKRKKVFCRVGPNKFSLLEWKTDLGRVE